METAPRTTPALYIPLIPELVSIKERGAAPSLLFALAARIAWAGAGPIVDRRISRGLWVGAIADAVIALAPIAAAAVSAIATLTAAISAVAAAIISAIATFTATVSTVTTTTVISTVAAAIISAITTLAAVSVVAATATATFATTR